MSFPTIYLRMTAPPESAMSRSHPAGGVMEERNAAGGWLSDWRQNYGPGKQRGFRFRVIIKPKHYRGASECIWHAGDNHVNPGEFG